MKKDKNIILLAIAGTASVLILLFVVWFLFFNREAVDFKRLSIQLNISKEELSSKKYKQFLKKRKLKAWNQKMNLIYTPVPKPQPLKENC